MEREKDIDDFKKLCDACEDKIIFRASTIKGLCEINKTLKGIFALLEDKASFTNRELSTIDCRLQTLENIALKLANLPKLGE